MINLNTKKKKSRQRNRPRNKANQCKDSTETDEIDDAGLSEILNDKKNMNAEVIEKNIKEEEKLIMQSNNEEKLLSTSENQVVTQTLYENNDAIKIVQQMMRAKLLKQNNANNSNEDKSSKKAATNENPSSSSIKILKSREKVADIPTETNAFITTFQKKMENAMSNGANDLPNALFDNLQKLLNQDPISDVESSDDEGEYIEYIYKPRQYFLVSLCNHCKCDLRDRELIQCSRCKMTYYCSPEHMKNDVQHKQLCNALQQVAENCDGHIFYKCGKFTTEQFRSYRIVTIRKVEAITNRPLAASEQEVVLFPRICSDTDCREYRFSKLRDCSKCGQVAFCKDKPEHLNKFHHLWCKAYQLFKEIILFQEKYGRLDPSLPTKVLKDIPGACSNTKQIFSKLGFDMRDPCEYAALSQISTCPLTAWYALKLCNLLKKSETMTIHLIGAEIEFEVDVLHKWELFFLHITPMVNELNIVFVGPELNPRNISFEQLRKTKCCRLCQKNGRTVKYHFENQIYHEYCGGKTFLSPDLICFFNAGLYRYNGFQLKDTWPETILAAANLKCPVVVTSYTEYEAPLDMSRFLQECNRGLTVVLPPTINPFASDKPERNFISDEDAPLMFKNYYCFVVE